MNSREEKIKSLMRYFVTGYTFLNGGEPVPVETIIEIQTHFDNLSDESLNQVYEDLEIKHPYFC
jgi:hypothetical protein